MEWPDQWGSVRNDIHYILSHPNGLEGTELNQMRRAAAVLAELHLLDILV
jgi:hypothetical protein